MELHLGQGLLPKLCLYANVALCKLLKLDALAHAARAKILPNMRLHLHIKSMMVHVLKRPIDWCNHET